MDHNLSFILWVFVWADHYLIHPVKYQLFVSQCNYGNKNRNVICGYKWAESCIHSQNQGISWEVSGSVEHKCGLRKHLDILFFSIHIFFKRYIMIMIGKWFLLVCFRTYQIVIVFKCTIWCGNIWTMLSLFLRIFQIVDLPLCKVFVVSDTIINLFIQKK